jgi:hypothetical protein
VELLWFRFLGGRVVDCRIWFWMEASIKGESNPLKHQNPDSGTQTCLPKQIGGSNLHSFYATFANRGVIATISVTVIHDQSCPDAHKFKFVSKKVTEFKCFLFYAQKTN